jgi:hypothetical protein
MGLVRVIGGGSQIVSNVFIRAKGRGGGMSGGSTHLVIALVWPFKVAICPPVKTFHTCADSARKKTLTLLRISLSDWHFLAKILYTDNFSFLESSVLKDCFCERERRANEKMSNGGHKQHRGMLRLKRGGGEGNA